MGPCAPVQPQNSLRCPRAPSALSNRHIDRTSSCVTWGKERTQDATKHMFVGENEAWSKRNGRRAGNSIVLICNWCRCKIAFGRCTLGFADEYLNMVTTKDLTTSRITLEYSQLQ